MRLFSQRVLLFALSVSCATALLTKSVRAQEGPEHLSPFARGAGQTYAITGRGLDAVGLNPALLTIPTPRPLEISLFPISSYGANAGPSWSQLNVASTAFSDTLSDAGRQEVTGFLYDNKLAGRADARLFGASYIDPTLGSFALTWTMHAALKTFMPDSLLNFFGKNAQTNLVQGILRKTSVDIQGLWYSEYGLTYARKLLTAGDDGGMELSAGVGLKYVSGIAYMRIDPASYIKINSPHNGGTTAIDVDYQLRFAYPDAFEPNNLPNKFSFDLLTSATAGSGFATDLGVLFGPKATADEPAPWSIGLSLAELGSITWTKHTDIRSARNTHIEVDFNAVSTDSINKYLGALGGTLDTTDASFSSDLPTTFHAAAQLNLAGIGIAPAGFQMSAAFEYALGLNDVVGSPNHGRFGMAVILERPDPTFAFHTALGLSTEAQNTTDVSLALGFGLWNRVLIDLGTSAIGGLFASDGHTDAAFSVKLLF